VDHRDVGQARGVAGPGPVEERRQAMIGCPTLVCMLTTVVLASGLRARVAARVEENRSLRSVPGSLRSPGFNVLFGISSV